MSARRMGRALAWVDGFRYAQPILREAAINTNSWEGAKPIAPRKLNIEYRIMKGLESPADRSKAPLVRK